MTRHRQWKFLDKLRRKAYVKNELKRILLKSVSRAETLPIIFRYSAQFNLSHTPRNSSLNKLRNRCIVSGRTWNVLKKAQYSRFVFRQRSYFSFMPGIRRASW